MWQRDGRTWRGDDGGGRWRGEGGEMGGRGEGGFRGEAGGRRRCWELGRGGEGHWCGNLQHKAEGENGLPSRGSISPAEAVT